MVDPYVLPKTEIIVDDSLSFTVKLYGCFLPENNPTYMKYRRSMRNTTISRLLHELESYVICCCVEPNGSDCSKLLHHVIPIYTDSDVSETQQFPHEGYWRAKGCLLFASESVSNL